MIETVTYSITQAAQYIGVSKRTLYNMLGDGSFDVEPVRGIRPRRWNREDIDAWRLRANADHSAAA